MPSTICTIIMARRQRSVDVFEITSEFCHGNVSYAAPTLSDAVWFTAGENGDYVVSDDAMATYEYALRLDPKYTPFPPPLRIGIICELSPVDNGLTSDGGLAGVPVDASALVKSRGNFVDYENGEDTQFKHSWMHLMSLAGSILPMSVDPSVATGMFRVLELQEPALCLVHSFLQASITSREGSPISDVPCYKCAADHSRER